MMSTTRLRWRSSRQWWNKKECDLHIKALFFLLLILYYNSGMNVMTMTPHIAIYSNHTASATRSWTGLFRHNTSYIPGRYWPASCCVGNLLRNMLDFFVNIIIWRQGYVRLHNTVPPWCIQYWLLPKSSLYGCQTPPVKVLHEATTRSVTSCQQNSLTEIEMLSTSGDR